MSLATDYTNSQDSALKQKILMATKAAAVSIVGEAATSFPTLDSKRHDLGETVLTSMNDANSPLLAQFALAACSGGVITTASSDTDISNRVSAIWNDLAGVSIRDQS